MPNNVSCSNHLVDELGYHSQTSIASTTYDHTGIHKGLDSSPFLSPSPSLSPPPSPTVPSLSETPSRSPSLTPESEQQLREELQDQQKQPQQEQPFTLLTHPAIVYASDQLSDSNYTSRFHTVKVFDFDQTLFQSPLPNPALWDPSFIGILTSWNYCASGWWQNPATLELGPAAEASCWKDWWNEDIVAKVRESSADPGCLTVLLTGRNGPSFGLKLVEMSRRKKLDFDIIATKPTTVARLESKIPFKPTLKAPKPLEQYLKVGQEWLDMKMLDHFDVTVVQERMVYLEPQREIDLVFAMVEANNKQVDIEAAGGPYLVTGLGPLPRTRPELKDRHMWDPYEVYIPHPRLRIEVTKIVRYTGVMFSEAVQKILRDNLGSLDQLDSASQWIERPDGLRGQDLSKWVVPDDFHVTLCLGPAPEDYLTALGGLGSTVLIEVVSVGQHEGRIWALQIKEFETASGQDLQDLQIVAPNGQIYTSLDDLRAAYKSKISSPSTSSVSTSNKYMSVDLGHQGHIILKRDKTPHITMAYDRLNGTRAVDSGDIKEWEVLKTPAGELFQKRLVFVGTIAEKILLGMKSRKKSGQQLSAAAKGEVSVANIIKSLMGDKDISGRQLGEMIRNVKEEMERLSVENMTANEERIATIAQEVCDRVESRKASSSVASSRQSSPTPP
ncbi:hypothetical protein BGZ99_002030 [Dissophora globulifera]|uniref:Swiss Army Knife RNA repair protein HAD domain-containing protein n=1 Tax=Dissophora globulifera TaxID=979702 RepID=A0A9P6RQX0_9FUNG|nr:hypothetical protein BGZ99_002030 [Dissophora globulifera]